MTGADQSPAGAHVRLLAFPLEVWARASEHHQELLREFALVGVRPTDAEHTPPLRLQQLIDELEARYAGLNEATDAERDAALARGETSIDLDYRGLPVEVAADCRHLDHVLDEVDDYCRAGDHLLTLATPPDCVTFRRWYLTQFVDQVERGAEPVPWPRWLAAAAGDA